MSSDDYDRMVICSRIWDTAPLSRHARIIKPCASCAALVYVSESLLGRLSRKHRRVCVTCIQCAERKIGAELVSEFEIDDEQLAEVSSEIGERLTREEFSRFTAKWAAMAAIKMKAKVK